MSKEETIGITDSRDLGVMGRREAIALEQTSQRLRTRFYRIRSSLFTPYVLRKFRRALLEGILAMPARAVRRFASHTRQSGFSVKCRTGEIVLVVVVDTSTLATRNPVITETLAQAAIRAVEDQAIRKRDAILRIAIRETRGKYELEFADSQILVRTSRLAGIIRAYEQALASCDSNSTVAYLAKRKLRAQLEDILYWESEKLPISIESPACAGPSIPTG